MAIHLLYRARQPYLSQNGLLMVRSVGIYSIVLRMYVRTVLYHVNILALLDQSLLDEKRHHLVTGSHKQDEVPAAYISTKVAATGLLPEPTFFGRNYIVNRPASR